MDTTEHTYTPGDIALWRLSFAPPQFVSVLADEGDDIYRVRTLEGHEHLALTAELSPVNITGNKP